LESRENKYQSHLRLLKFNDEFGVARDIDKKLVLGEKFILNGKMFEVLSFSDRAKWSKRSRKKILKPLEIFYSLRKKGIIRTNCEIGDLCLQDEETRFFLLEIIIHSKAGEIDTSTSILLNINYIMFNDNLKDKTPSEIEILFGTCMFRSDTACLVGESGKKFFITSRLSKVDEKIVDFNFSSGIKLYEDELLTRICAIFKSLFTDSIRYKLKSILPHAPYYFFILDAYEQGFVSKMIVLRWFEALDLHVEQQQQLESIYFKSQNPELERHQSEFLAKTPGVLSKYIKKKKKYDSDTLKRILIRMASSSAIGKKFVKSAIEKPVSWLQFSDMIYTLSVLESMGEELKEKHKMVFCLLDYSEAKLLKNCSDFRNILLGMEEKVSYGKGLHPVHSDNLSFIGFLTPEHIVYDFKNEETISYIQGEHRLSFISEKVLSREAKNQILNYFKNRGLI
jgi:hypothetical protein